MQATAKIVPDDEVEEAFEIEPMPRFHPILRNGENFIVGQG